MTRLADFSNPPVDEVVLGVQFESPLGYTSVHAGAVWELFRAEYPKVNEVPRLEPQFEVFGGNPTPGFQFAFGSPPLRSRLWFISADETHLIQFQEDRIFLNWRKRPNGESPPAPYPRYEQISAAFASALKQLNEFFVDRFQVRLKITQAEAAYFNTVPMAAFSEVGSDFRFLSTGPLNVEGFATNIVETILDDRGHPRARAYYELQSMLVPDGSKIGRFSITVRGKPENDEISGGLAFLDFARLNIISRFCDLTTEEAHQRWGRTT